ncbi:DUF1700 domain-containing protein [Massilia cavernae]|uniref:DUF1700 domain-containing protein n=1 Tax=Massilia cavernae TaxID=2320864 RepID=A0A418XQX4_9BURK|nr:DUF1700 domain-containing protein [Massilia cavernae]RJG14904.1 DUF1700 domain-containing protein [Massilia cavernae]
MGKLEYLDALKRAMAGLPPETQARTLAFYEQRFVDGVAAGRSEEEIAKELGDPKKIAMTLRASTHMRAFEEKRNPANFVRLVVSGLGLAIFNLFMVVPAIVYASLLAALYGAALGFYLGGVAVTASGLAGATELVLDGPLKHFVIHGRDDHGIPRQAKVTIDATGVHVDENAGDRESMNAEVEAAAAEVAAQAAAEAAAGAEAAARAAEEAAAEASAEADAAAFAAGDPDGDASRSERVIRRAEAVAERGVKIYTDRDSDSRATQSAVGLAMVLGGIVLFLLALVITRYTFIGIRRYIQMNLSLLKGS